MHDLMIFAGVAATLGLMAAGVKLFGTGGGFAGFFIGAIMTGVVAANLGVDLGGGGCERYSSIANDC